MGDCKSPWCVNGLIKLYDNGTTYWVRCPECNNLPLMENKRNENSPYGTKNMPEKFSVGVKTNGEKFSLGVKFSPFGEKGVLSENSKGERVEEKANTCALLQSTCPT